jgi:hypothetical protein
MMSGTTKAVQIIRPSGTRAAAFERKSSLAGTVTEPRRLPSEAMPYTIAGAMRRAVTQRIAA